MKIAVNLLAGLLFGVGLAISGMLNPAKVLNFLDLFGTWDPSLAFVMGAAVLVTFLGYRFVLHRPAPILSERFQFPTVKSIDRRVIVGPAIFGIGWGLVGFCPGPAIASLSLLSKGVLVFVPATFAGMALARLLTSRGEGVATPSPMLAHGKQ